MNAIQCCNISGTINDTNRESCTLIIVDFSLGILEIATRFTRFKISGISMDGRILVELKDCSITFVGLVGLQLPCMVSRASPSSPFARLRSLGFLFNMSTSTLNKHFAFSPENLAQGRYHTLISNLFHHVGKISAWF